MDTSGIKEGLDVLEQNIKRLISENDRLKSENNTLGTIVDDLCRENRVLSNKLYNIRSDKEVILKILKNNDSPIDSLCSLINNGTLLNL